MKVTRYQYSSACWFYRFDGKKVGEWWPTHRQGYIMGVRGTYRWCSEFEEDLARRLIEQGADLEKN